MRLLTGRMPRANAPSVPSRPVGLTAPRRNEPDHRQGETHGSGRALRSCNPDRVPPRRGEGQGDDGAVLGADDHGAHDEDLGVRLGGPPPRSGRRSTRRRYQLGGKPRVGTNPALHLLPYRSELVPKRDRPTTARRAVAEIDVAIALSEIAAPLVETEEAQLGDDLVRPPLHEVELDGVPVRFAHRRQEHRQIGNRLIREEQRQNPRLSHPGG